MYDVLHKDMHYEKYRRVAKGRRWSVNLLACTCCCCDKSSSSSTIICWQQQQDDDDDDDKEEVGRKQDVLSNGPIMLTQSGWIMEHLTTNPLLLLPLQTCWQPVLLQDCCSCLLLHSCCQHHSCYFCFNSYSSNASTATPVMLQLLLQDSCYYFSTIYSLVVPLLLWFYGACRFRSTGCVTPSPELPNS